MLAEMLKDITILSLHESCCFCRSKRGCTPQVYFFPFSVIKFSLVFRAMEQAAAGQAAAGNNLSRKRDQSKIMKQWWKRKKEFFVESVPLKVEIEKLKEELAAALASKEEMKSSNKSLSHLNRTIAAERDALLGQKEIMEAERDVLKAEVAVLQSTNELLSEENKNISNVLEQNLQFSNVFEPLSKSLESFGGFTKVTEKCNAVIAVGAALISVLAVLMRHTKPITRLRTVVEALFSQKIFGVQATTTVLQEMYKTYFFKEQRAVFAPWRVLRAMDLSSVGGLNYNGLETLRQVEELEKYERGVLPSRSSVQRVAYDLHSLGQQHIPFHRHRSDLGEMFQYDYERFIRFILKTFKLHEIAQRESVEISFTLDGAELCDGISHLTAGIKITDSRAVDPRDGSPLCLIGDGELGRLFNNQSRNNCFAMKSLIGKDSKAAYKEFADIFKFFENLKKYGLPASELGPAIYPVETWIPQDLASIWKSLNTGCGARKNGDTHFCHLCPCTGNTIVRFLVDENR